MSWKIASFIFIPLILFSCTCLHFYRQSKAEDRFNNLPQPISPAELDEQTRDIFGSKR